MADPFLVPIEVAAYWQWLPKSGYQRSPILLVLIRRNRLAYMKQDEEYLLPARSQSMEWRCKTLIQRYPMIEQPWYCRPEGLFELDVRRLLHPR